MSERIGARRAAYASLVAFTKHGKYTNLEVDAALSKYELSDADRRLYTNLVYGVAERLTTLDYIIGTLSDRPIGKIDTETMTCLRLGIYQLVYTDRIPDHAAVSETVALAGKNSKGFVNAILREFIRRGKKYPMPGVEDRAAYLSVKYSCPRPLVEFFISSLGEELSEKILSASVSERRATVRVNTLVSNAEELIADVFPDAVISRLSNDLISVPSLYGADMTDGRWFVQDAASRVAVAALDPRRGETVVDTCASPGGKSFSAAIDMENEGKIYSFDLHKNKIDLIKKGAGRLGISIIEASCRDATDPDRNLIGRADRVICDAPCSGLGVIGKKPDIKYKNIEDIEKLPTVQLRVLNGASSYVRDGGTLVYSTCTVNPAENEAVVKAFLKDNGEFSLSPFTACGITAPQGYLTLYPHEYDTDGFFIAKMIKRTEDNI